MDTTTEGTTQMLTTADRLRAEAAECDRSAEESFQRCDTDGFLSQWASGITAQEKRAQANIEEAGGKWRFRKLVLVDAKTGRRISDARRLETKFGARWRIDSLDLWLPVGWGEGNGRKMKQAGLAEKWVTVTAPAKAKVHAPGRGLSGACNARIIIVRTDDLPGGGREAAEWLPLGPPRTR